MRAWRMCVDRIERVKREWALAGGQAGRQGAVKQYPVWGLWHGWRQGEACCELRTEGCGGSAVRKGDGRERPLGRKRVSVVAVV
jgi:hypothetical protein